MHSRISSPCSRRAATVSPLERTYIDAFTRSFAEHFDAADLRRMPEAIAMRAADRNVTDAERAALRSAEWPIG